MSCNDMPVEGGLAGAKPAKNLAAYGYRVVALERKASLQDSVCGSQIFHRGGKK